MSDTGDWQRRLPPRTASRGWLHDHMLTIVLATLFLASWLGQFIAQLAEVSNNAQEHGQSFSWSEFWPQFFTSTFENWQSEFLQLFSFVALTAVLIHRNSAESADGDDEIKAMLEELMARTEPSDAHAVRTPPD